MKIKINLKKKTFYILIIGLILIGFVFASNWNAEVSHSDLRVKNIYSKNADDSITFNDNLTFSSGKDVKIAGKSVINSLVAGSGITIVTNGNSATISSSGSTLGGYEIISNSSVCTGCTGLNNRLYSIAQCSPGKKAIGGGCSYDMVDNGATNLPWIQDMKISDNNMQFICSIQEVSSVTRTLTSKVICVDII